MTIENLKNILLGKNAKDILEFSKIYSLPIDIKYILRDKLEININDNLDWDRLALDGCVYLNNKGYPEIWINSSIPENRQNFTLAHELGHIINDILPNIEKYKNPIEDNYSTLYRNGNINKMEKMANSFAAELLMPKEFIYKEAKNLTESKDFDTLTLEQVIKRMSNRFRVSFDAMKWRLVNLGYIEKSKIF